MRIQKKLFISLILTLIVSAILYVKSEFGNDYYGYLKYKSLGLAFERWPNEPFSALIIGLSGEIFNNMRFLYSFSVLFFGISIIIFLNKLNQLEIEKFLFLFINPGSIIVFGAPRFLLGISFFIIAISYKRKINSLIIYLISILSHNFAFPILYLSRFFFENKSRILKFFIILIISISSYFIYKYLESIPFLFYYFNNISNRGTLRSIYYLFSVISIIPFIRSKYFLKRFFSQFLILSLLIIITFINPLLNRITFLNYLILQLDVIEKNKTLLSRNYYTFFSIINILIFSSILFLGIYGFAPNELQRFK